MAEIRNESVWQNVQNKKSKRRNRGKNLNASRNDPDEDQFYSKNCNDEILTMLVSSSDIGRIIGRRGKKIKDIQAKSGSIVRIESDKKFVDTDVEIKIIGSKSNNNYAKKIIEGLISFRPPLENQSVLPESSNSYNKPSKGFLEKQEMEKNCIDNCSDETEYWDADQNTNLEDLNESVYHDLGPDDETNNSNCINIGKNAKSENWEKETEYTNYKSSFHAKEYFDCILDAYNNVKIDKNKKFKQIECQSKNIYHQLKADHKIIAETENVQNNSYILLIVESGDSSSEKEDENSKTEELQNQDGIDDPIESQLKTLGLSSNSSENVCNESQSNTSTILQTLNSTKNSNRSLSNTSDDTWSDSENWGTESREMQIVNKINNYNCELLASKNELIKLLEAKQRTWENDLKRNEQQNQKTSDLSCSSSENNYYELHSDAKPNLQTVDLDKMWSESKNWNPKTEEVQDKNRISNYNYVHDSKSEPIKLLDIENKNWKEDFKKNEEQNQKTLYLSCSSSENDHQETAGFNINCNESLSKISGDSKILNNKSEKIQEINRINDEKRSNYELHSKNQLYKHSAVEKENWNKDLKSNEEQNNFTLNLSSSSNENVFYKLHSKANTILETGIPHNNLNYSYSETSYETWSDSETDESDETEEVQKVTRNSDKEYPYYKLDSKSPFVKQTQNASDVSSSSSKNADHELPSNDKTTLQTVNIICDDSDDACSDTKNWNNKTKKVQNQNGINWEKYNYELDSQKNVNSCNPIKSEFVQLSDAKNKNCDKDFNKHKEQNNCIIDLSTSSSENICHDLHSDAETILETENLNKNVSDSQSISSYETWSDSETEESQDKNKIYDFDNDKKYYDSTVPQFSTLFDSNKDDWIEESKIVEKLSLSLTKNIRRDVKPNDKKNKNKNYSDSVSDDEYIWSNSENGENDTKEIKNKMSLEEHFNNQLGFDNNFGFDLQGPIKPHNTKLLDAEEKIWSKDLKKNEEQNKIKEELPLKDRFSALCDLLIISDDAASGSENCETETVEIQNDNGINNLNCPDPIDCQFNEGSNIAKTYWDKDVIAQFYHKVKTNTNTILETSNLENKHEEMQNQNETSDNDYFDYSLGYDNNTKSCLLNESQFNNPFVLENKRWDEDFKLLPNQTENTDYFSIGLADYIQQALNLDNETTFETKNQNQNNSKFLNQNWNSFERERENWNNKAEEVQHQNEMDEKQYFNYEFPDNITFYPSNSQFSKILDENKVPEWNESAEQEKWDALWIQETKDWNAKVAEIENKKQEKEPLGRTDLVYYQLDNNMVYYTDSNLPEVRQTFSAQNNAGFQYPNGSQWKQPLFENKFNIFSFDSHNNWWYNAINWNLNFIGCRWSQLIRQEDEIQKQKFANAQLNYEKDFEHEKLEDFENVTAQETHSSLNKSAFPKFDSNYKIDLENANTLCENPLPENITTNTVKGDWCNVIIEEVSSISQGSESNASNESIEIIESKSKLDISKENLNEKQSDELKTSKTSYCDWNDLIEMEESINYSCNDACAIDFYNCNIVEIEVETENTENNDDVFDQSIDQNNPSSSNMISILKPVEICGGELGQRDLNNEIKEKGNDNEKFNAEFRSTKQMIKIDKVLIPNTEEEKVDIKNFQKVTQEHPSRLIYNKKRRATLKKQKNFTAFADTPKKGEKKNIPLINTVGFY